MQDYLNRVNGWIKYRQFEKLQIASVGEIVYYIKEMYREAEKRRLQYGLPSRDVGTVGGYDVRSISTIPLTEMNLSIKAKLIFHLFRKDSFPHHSPTSPFFNTRTEHPWGYIYLY